LVIKDVRVPAIAMAESRPIGPVNDQAISLFAWFGISVAATYTGVAIAALKFAREFAGRLKPLPQPRTIKYLPGIQFAIAEAEALIAQSRALYLGVARDYIHDRDSFKGEAGLARVVMPKYVATNNAVRAVDYCMEVVGAHGMLKKFPWSATTATFAPAQIIRCPTPAPANCWARSRSASGSLKRRAGR
jgi:alkylation response protein AidB-like acyl-CoA dehydrogenase